MTERRGVADADLFGVPRRALLDAREELSLKLVGQLEANRVVMVGELVANIARVGPG